ncbi:MAG: hypothetical protein EHM40_10115 [Chloroflexi bacterium]|nr:MAG: hypothetical protein EHM40_10115 [Chloroflexota bacterium]
MKSTKYFDLFLAGIVAFSAYQFHYVWLVWKGFADLERVAYALEDRPFVYRLLVPSLARVLEKLTGIPAVPCMIFLVVLSSVGLFYSLLYLYTAFSAHREPAGMFAFVGCELTFMWILIGVKVYDIATAMFFALALALLARRKFNSYYVLFLIASLNRETTFLLTLFFSVYFFNRMPRRHYFFGLLYQGLAYTVVKITTMILYRDVPGTVLSLNPVGVLRGYVDQPVWFAVLLFVFFCLFLVIAIWQWNAKPGFLRAAFITLFPALLLLHILMGYPYEIRVFAEVFPVLLMLCAWSIPALSYRSALQQPQAIEAGG